MEQNYLVDIRMMLLLLLYIYWIDYPRRYWSFKLHYRLYLTLLPYCPYYLFHHTCGCITFVHLHKNQWTKLDHCVFHCIFLGYATNKKGYHCYNSTNKFTYLMIDVTFLEVEFFFTFHRNPLMIFKGRHRMKNNSGRVLRKLRKLIKNLDLAR